MSTSVSVVVPAAVKAPRGAFCLGQLFGAGQALLRALRATREAGRRARDAAEVRALARSLEKVSPGMASDLYAAADRHAG